MSLQKALAILGLCAMLILCIGLFADVAHAQAAKETKNAAKKVDKSLASKKGVSGALANGKKEDEKPEAATPVQMAIGIGSIFVMIAVVKWL